MNSQLITTYQLSFVRIDIRGERLAELVIAEDIEIDPRMVDELHEFLKTHLLEPFVLLIDNLYAHSYSWDAQMRMGNIPEVFAVGFVNYNRRSQVATETMIQIPRDIRVNFRLFRDRDDALEWSDLQLRRINDFLEFRSK